jgi:ABC-type proline/glycine betaine transport system permease subunit
VCRAATEANEPFDGLRQLTDEFPLWEDAMNNSSMFTADRTTHLKIVVMSLVCATLVAGIGIAARITDSGGSNGRIEATVIRATAPVTAAAPDVSTVR